MYDKFPFLLSGPEEQCTESWPLIAERIRMFVAKASTGKQQICVECYPGAFVAEIEGGLRYPLVATLVIRTEMLFRSPEEIDALLAAYLTDDPVFGHMNTLDMESFFDASKLTEARAWVDAAKDTVLVVGPGASLVVPQPTVLVYADMARWELQLRQRRNEIANLGAENFTERAALKYKRAFFVDWRTADRLKRTLLDRIDFLLDTNKPGAPKLISGDAFRGALARAARQPFRVVPFFDPGPWGGHWMEREFDLPTEGVPNHAWCFDCVPEENSLFLGFGDARVELPSIDVVFAHPRELLGDNVYERFGAEFPIRFDFLDTMGGGNLSLQVHPLTAYIREHFGMDYTQDESYYMLDADPGAGVYLGIKDNIEPADMMRDLEAAQAGEEAFDAEKYVNRFPAKKHDHFLIPAGTVHCSGKDSMVLEISATPYIFTFKLWDWGRLGLDGRPRPVHLQHGFANIQWDRKTDWSRNSLVNQFEPAASGEGWREERTGLHELEFIETRRHWFTGTVPHSTRGTVNVLNLVEGQEAIVESPTGAFEPFLVHYAETFIVPAAVGDYTIRPHGPSVGQECATMLAYVRATN
jgi:mannose-6-phosphate isomerase class I